MPVHAGLCRLRATPAVLRIGLTFMATPPSCLAGCACQPRVVVGSSKEKEAHEIQSWSCLKSSASLANDTAATGMHVTLQCSNHRYFAFSGIA